MKIWADPQLYPLLYYGKLTSNLSFGAEGPLNYGGVVKKEITLTANDPIYFAPLSLCIFLTLDEEFQISSECLASQFLHPNSKSMTFFQ